MRDAPPGRRAGWASYDVISTSEGIDMPPSPPPMLTLSLPRVARATVQPPLTGPMTSSSGTNTSLKKTSLKSDAPEVCRSGRTSTPFACMSMIIIVMPWCFGTSGSVRTVAKPLPASCAPLVHTFWPLTSHPPSVRVPRVLMPAASEPAAGSRNSRNQMSSWRSAGGAGGLAERQPPEGSWAKRGRAEPLHLLRGRVLDDCEQVPAGDAVRRPLDAGGCELLLDDELLDGAGVAAPRRGPVRHHVTGLDHRVTASVGVEVLHPRDELAHLTAD